jgi:phage FluMu gp28-like protein
MSDRYSVVKVITRNEKIYQDWISGMVMLELSRKYKIAESTAFMCVQRHEEVRKIVGAPKLERDRQPNKHRCNTRPTAHQAASRPSELTSSPLAL